MDGSRNLGKRNLETHGSIDGRVITRDGQPVVDATVAVTGDSPPHPDIAALTDEEGRFEFHDVIPGKYELTATSDQYSSARCQVEVGQGARAQAKIRLR